SGGLLAGLGEDASDGEPLGRQPDAGLLQRRLSRCLNHSQMILPTNSPPGGRWRRFPAGPPLSRHGFRRGALAPSLPVAVSGCGRRFYYGPRRGVRLADRAHADRSLDLCPATALLHCVLLLASGLPP